jgi:hypothetical protein
MPYMRGDYVGGRSNYVRGDPFLGAALGFVAKKVAGPLVKKAGRWIGKQTVGGLIGKTAATAATGVAISKATRAEPIVIDPGAAFPGGEPFIEFTGQRKKYRRMNPLNPKALRRALRRAEGFEKFAKKTMSALTKPGSVRKYKSRSKRG